MERIYTRMKCSAAELALLVRACEGFVASTHQKLAEFQARFPEGIPADATVDLVRERDFYANNPAKAQKLLDWIKAFPAKGATVPMTEKEFKTLHWCAGEIARAASGEDVRGAERLRERFHKVLVNDRSQDPGPGDDEEENE